MGVLWSLFWCILMDLSFSWPGEKILGLKRISKMMSLTDPTSLQALLTASLLGESPDNTQINTYDHSPKIDLYQTPIPTSHDRKLTLLFVLTRLHTLFQSSVLPHVSLHSLRELRISVMQRQNVFVRMCTNKQT